MRGRVRLDAAPGACRRSPAPNRGDRRRSSAGLAGAILLRRGGGLGGGRRAPPPLDEGETAMMQRRYFVRLVAGASLTSLAGAHRAFAQDALVAAARKEGKLVWYT